jgi:hypothetical protein
MHIASTKPVEADPSKDAKKLDNMLADSDRALYQRLRGPAVVSSNFCCTESAEADYIDQLLRVADAQLRQQLGMGDADRFELS